MNKAGIDSFLLPCHTNDNLFEIEAAFGIKGFAVIVRLWQKIYAEEGYYCEWQNKHLLLFLAKWFGGGSGVDANFIKEVVNMAIANGIFDQKKYEQYSILTSAEIQERYFEVCKRRTTVNAKSEYLLISVTSYGNVVCKNQENVYKNEENVSISSISKVKESKVKLSKEKETKEKERPKSRKATRLSEGEMLNAIREQCFGEEINEAATDWVRYKLERNEGYAQIGFKNLITQLKSNIAKYGEVRTAEAIRNTMANGWMGIVWNKTESKISRTEKILRRNEEVDSW